jgi:hypothetical protein
VRIVLAVTAAVACKPMAPPPVVAFHGDTAAAPVDTTTVMLVVGLASQGFTGAIGVALRAERQVTTRTTAGLELTGGFGESEVPEGKRWLVGLRGYGRGTPRSRDWVAVTYGAGLSVMDVGLVTLTAHGGGAVSYPNDHAAPFLGAGLALAIPLHQRERYGAGPGFVPREHITNDPPTEPDLVGRALYGYLDGGVVALFGDTGNRLSLDVGVLSSLFSDHGLYSLSLADAQRFDP